MVYAEDDDLKIYRSNILELGVLAWDDQHDAAALIINRDIDVGWYREACAGRSFNSALYPSNRFLYYQAIPFDSKKLLNAAMQLKRLGCYKALEIIYGTLAKDAKDDPFREQSKDFKALYEAELKAVLKAGLDYDWDDSGTIDATESAIDVPRRLVKC